MRSLLLAGLLLAAPVTVAALAPAPPEARALKEAGDQRRKAGDAEGALESYRAAVAKHAAYPEAYQAIGQVEFGRKRFGAAVDAFGLAVEADPGYALAWYNLAFAATKGGDLSRARNAYDAYVKLRPTDPDGHYGLAETLRATGDREAAAGEYQRFLELAASKPGQEARVEKAKAALAELQGQPSGGPSVGGLLGGTAVGGAMGVAAPPSPATTEAPTPAPAPARAPAASAAAAPSQAIIEKLGAGDRAYLAGDYRGALFLYQDAAYLDPGSSSARVRMARAYAALRHPEQAEAQLHLVLAQDPGNPEALKGLQELQAGSPGPATPPSTTPPPAGGTGTGGRVFKLPAEAAPSPASGPPAPRPEPTPSSP